MYVYVDGIGYKIYPFGKSIYDLFKTCYNFENKVLYLKTKFKLKEFWNNHNGIPDYNGSYITEEKNNFKYPMDLIKIEDFLKNDLYNNKLFYDKYKNIIKNYTKHKNDLTNEQKLLLL